MKKKNSKKKKRRSILFLLAKQRRAGKIKDRRLHRPLEEKKKKLKEGILDSEDGS